MKLLVLNKQLEGDIHANGLDADEQERLVCLMEECAEVIHAAGKTLRHGYDSRHPETQESNREAIQRELGQLQFTIDQMLRHKDIYMHELDVAHHEKAESVAQYLHYTEVLD
jgi:hypothetical protein